MGREYKRKNHSSAAALCIIKDNKIVLEHYSGYHTNTSTNKRVTASSQFNIASARKSYLALMIAYALYEGKINSIDDEAIKYFKDFDPVLLGKTTIRHLVTHSHGLEETNDGTIFREFEPGQGWAYRDINVRMMTRLIYQLYNKSFPELLKERVFKHANFQETGWRVQQDENLVEVVNDPNEDAISAIGTVDDGTEKICLFQLENLLIGKSSFKSRCIKRETNCSKRSYRNCDKFTESNIYKQ